MKTNRLFWLLLLLPLGTGCVTRIGIYAPHRSNTEEHRRAAVNSDCLGCHNPTERKTHAATDDCLRCHILCREC